MVAVLWKDVWFGTIVFLFTVVVAWLLLDHKARGRVHSWLLLAVLLGVIPHFRHNGLLILMGMALIIPLWFGQWRRQAVLSAAGAVAVYLGIRFGMGAALSITQYRWYHGIRLSRIASVIDQDVPLSTDEYEFLNSVRPLDDRWASCPINRLKLLSNKKFRINKTYLFQRYDVLKALHDSLFWRYPLLFSRHYFRQTTYLYRPCEPADQQMFYLSGARKWHIGPVGASLAARDIPTWIRYVLLQTEKPSFSWLFWRPALHLYVVLFAAVVLLYRTREYHLLLIYLPVLLNTLSLFLVVVSQCHRYQFALTLSTSWLCCLAFLPRHTENATVQPSATICADKADSVPAAT